MKATRSSRDTIKIAKHPKTHWEVGKSSWNSHEQDEFWNHQELINKKSPNHSQAIIITKIAKPCDALTNQMNESHSEAPISKNSFWSTLWRSQNFGGAHLQRWITTNQKQETIKCDDIIKPPEVYKTATKPPKLRESTHQRQWRSKLSQHPHQQWAIHTNWRLSPTTIKSHNHQKAVLYNEGRHWDYHQRGISPRHFENTR